MGRPRKPIEQQQREGNPGKRRLPAPIPVDGVPAKPANLPPAAGWLWDIVVPALVETSIAKLPDTPELVALCIQWARAEEARDVIERDGIMAMGSTGQLAPHPALAVERAAHLVFLKFAQENGLTPAARARIAAAIAGARDAFEDDELADVIDLTPELRVVE